MSRTKGTYSLTSNIESKFGAPLDARTVVKLKTDLTASGTFDYPYIGLTVFVEEENKKYTLIGADPTVASNWMEEIVVDDLGTAAYRDVPDSGDAGFNQVVLGKDTRLTYYDRNRYDAQVKCSTNIVEGNIIVGVNGLYHHLNDGTVFDITYPILYAKNNMAAGAANKSNYDSLAIDITITQQMTLTQFLPVYIKGILSGNMFNPISTTPLTQETAQDGYHYILLGLASTSTKIYLFHDHRIFAHKNGSFCEIVGNLGTAAYKDIPASGNASIYQVVTGNDTRLSDARPASDVSSWAKASTKPTYTASEVGAIPATEKGAASGVAELDANGYVPSSQLPSYVDDIVDGYYADENFYDINTPAYDGYLYNGDFYKDVDHTIVITPETDTYYYDITGDKFYQYSAMAYVEVTAPTALSPENGKLYINVGADPAEVYRWTGHEYVKVSSGDGGLVLGETEYTAYRGDRGKTAYDHSQDQNRVTTAVSSGLYKFGVTAQGHIASTTPVQKSDITALGIPAQDTTYGVVSKSANGLAPQLPNETTTTKYLRQDGTWVVPPDTNTTYTFAGGTNKFTVTPSGGTAQNVNITASDSTKLPLAGGNMTGAGGIQFPTTAGPSLPNNWISAGGGYSTGSGKSGLKIIACEQADCVSGLGQDCGGGPYELSIITGASTTGDARIRFLSHKVASPATYTKMAELQANGNFVCTSINGFTIGTSVPANAKFTDTNTTYTFAGGTNGFTVTPSGGTAQTVTVTPSISLVETANKLNGFSSRSTTMAWGNQTGTVITCFSTPNGGGWGFRDNNPANGQTSMTIDGTVYIKEGNVNVGDAVKSFSVSGTTVTYTTLWGNTGTFTTSDHTYNFSGASFISGNSGNGTHDANAADSNGIFYFTSNGPTQAQGWKAPDNSGFLINMYYSSTWGIQIAQDFYDNGAIWIRSKTNNVWGTWKKPDAGTINGLTLSLVT